MGCDITESNIYSKDMVYNYLYQYSRFYSIRLYECETLYLEGKGYAAITLLFACLENIVKSVANDFDSSFYAVVEKVKNRCIITNDEYNFISINDNSIRKIRNLFAHANVIAINLINYENGNEILYPLSEEESCLLLYEKTSLIICNIIFKLVIDNFIDDVRNKFTIDLAQAISNCNLQFKTLTSKEMLVLKGFPEDYISDDLDIPEDARLRLIDNV